MTDFDKTGFGKVLRRLDRLGAGMIKFGLYGLIWIAILIFAYLAIGAAFAP